MPFVNVARPADRVNPFDAVTKPLKFAIAAVNVPVVVGLADIITLPVPVMAFETKVLEPSEKTGNEAVRAETIGPNVNID